MERLITTHSNTRFLIANYRRAGKRHTLGMDNFRKKIIVKIKAKLKASGKTQEKLAFEIDMSKGFLGEILAGKKSFRIEVLKRIADGLEVNAKDLLP
jgi:hypothetical protein